VTHRFGHHISRDPYDWQKSFRCHDSGLADVSGLVSAFLWASRTEKRRPPCVDDAIILQEESLAERPCKRQRLVQLHCGIEWVLAVAHGMLRCVFVANAANSFRFAGVLSAPCMRPNSSTLLAATLLCQPLIDFALPVRSVLYASLPDFVSISEIALDSALIEKPPSRGAIAASRGKNC